jgi:NhaA family Na+:H+ antiporter
VSVSGDTLGDVVSRAEPLGVALGLAAGKVLGIFGGTYLAIRFTRAHLSPDLAQADVFAVAMLAGIGFTVSLLIGELAYPNPADQEHIKSAVLIGSLTSAVLACVLLRLRNNKYRRLYEEETLDENADGIPDIYQQPSATGQRHSTEPETPNRDRPHHSGGPDDPSEFDG